MEVLDFFQAAATDQTMCKLPRSQRRLCDTAWQRVPRQKDRQRHGKLRAEVHQPGRVEGDGLEWTDHDEDDGHQGAAVGQLGTG